MGYKWGLYPINGALAHRRISKPIIGGGVDVAVRLFPFSDRHTRAQQTLSNATEKACRQPLGGPKQQSALDDAHYPHRLRPRWWWPPDGGHRLSRPPYPSQQLSNLACTNQQMARKLGQDNDFRQQIQLSKTKPRVPLYPTAPNAKWVSNWRVQRSQVKH